MEQKYIGAKGVQSVVAEKDIKTPGGADCVTVLYLDGSKELMPKVSFELLVSTAPSDATILREIKLKDLAGKILKVIAEHDLKTGEIDELNRRVGAALFESVNRANHFLWTKDNTSFVPGINSVLERSILDTEQVLRTIPTSNGESGK